MTHNQSLPPPVCPMGFTSAELDQILGSRRAEFDRWMGGQTATICEGRKWNYTTSQYEPDECAESPHGMVVYRHDVDRFMLGSRVLD